jgi:hypothetical protein
MPQVGLTIVAATITITIATTNRIKGPTGVKANRPKIALSANYLRFARTGPRIYLRWLKMSTLKQRSIHARLCCAASR